MHISVAILTRNRHLRIGSTDIAVKLETSRLKTQYTGITLDKNPKEQFRYFQIIRMVCRQWKLSQI